VEGTGESHLTNAPKLKVFYDDQCEICRAWFPGCACSTEEGSRSASVFDSLKWIATLRRLLDLEIEILVERHDFVHTMRRKVPDTPGLVISTPSARGAARKSCGASGGCPSKSNRDSVKGCR
jgi:hypothetical protein